MNVTYIVYIEDRTVSKHWRTTFGVEKMCSVCTWWFYNKAKIDMSRKLSIYLYIVQNRNWLSKEPIAHWLRYAVQIFSRRNRWAAAFICLLQYQHFDFGPTILVYHKDQWLFLCVCYFMWLWFSTQLKFSHHTLWYILSSSKCTYKEMMTHSNTIILVPIPISIWILFYNRIVCSHSMKRCICVGCCWFGVFAALHQNASYPFGLAMFVSLIHVLLRFMPVVLFIFLLRWSTIITKYQSSFASWCPLVLYLYDYVASKTLNWILFPMRGLLTAT